MIAKILIVALFATVAYAQNVTNATITLQIANRNPKPLYLEILSNQIFRPIVIAANATLNHTLHRPVTARIFGRVDCATLEACRRDGLIPVTIAGLHATLNNVSYDVSLEDGFNTGVSIEPVGATGTGHSCARASCVADILATCPKELQLVREDQLLACRTACEALRTDQYCCRGSYGTAETCDVTKWPTNYVDYFHKQCPDTFAYRFDSMADNTYSCSTATEFLVTFGSAPK